MKASNKVLYNVGILCLKMFITSGISLYTTRVVLNELGVTDYGIYNLITGVITMLTFLNTAMTTSTLRYLSFYQGKDDLDMQKKVFAGSMQLHALTGLLLVVILEVSAYFLFNGFLNIPAERLSTTKMIYHFLSISILFNILSVPYMATLTARENMLWVAIVNTVETLLKLGAAFLIFIVSGDKLIYFGLMTALVTVVSFVFYVIYCHTKYPECKNVEMTKKINPQLMKELTSFAGWNVFGTLCGTIRMQGLAVILNVLFGAVINAAYGIANQISLQLNFFAATLLRTLNPQIMKSEGANDQKRMLRLSMIASKFSFFLQAVFAIPCIFEMQELLSFWLKEVPDYTVVFCSLMLITILANQLTIGLSTAIQATGRIKAYQTISGMLVLFNLPIVYFLLKAGSPPYIVLVSYIIIELLGAVLRLVFTKKITGMSIKEFSQNVFMKEIIPVLVITLTSYLVTQLGDMEFRFLLTISVSMITFMISIYFTGLCDDEKILVHDFLKKIKFQINAIIQRHKPAQSW